jgi:hypothetical protein
VHQVEAFSTFHSFTSSFLSFINVFFLLLIYSATSNSADLHDLLPLLLTTDSLQFMNKKSLYLQNLPIRLLLPRKKNAFVTCTFYRLCGNNVQNDVILNCNVYTAPPGVDNAACSSKMRSLPNTWDVAKQDNTMG